MDLSHSSVSVLEKIHDPHVRIPGLSSRSDSLLSDGRLGLPSCSPTNSTANSDDGHLTINDNGNASEQSCRMDTSSYRPYSSKPAGFEGFRGLLVGSRSLFTASQWQELEHQALIFKYMMAGVPVPSDLVIPIRKSVATLSFALSTGSYQPRMAWSSSHMGFGSTITDPEPGRCRRTDGKKWRCARDVVPDQKYCERHMHRGRNRSRKPVEAHNAASPSQSDPAPSSSNIHARTPYSSLAINPRNHNTYRQHQCQSSLPISSKLLLQVSSDSTSTMASNTEYRCLNGMRRDVDRQIFSSGSTGEPSQDSVLSSIKNEGWRSNMPSKLLQVKTEQSEPSNAGLGFAVEYCNGVSEGHGKPLRHFFDDWPQSRNGSCSEVEEDRSNRSSSTIHLSISIPIASSGFCATNSSPHCRGGGGSGAVDTKKLSQ